MMREWASFCLALQFLTRLPVPTGGAFSDDLMARSVRYFPLVGGIVGGLCVLVLLAAASLFPDFLAILIALAAGLLLTGAFHEDGLADTFDGIGGGATRESALSIMRDSRLGTYGTLALIVSLGLQAAALIALPWHLVAPALVAGHVLSRLSSVLVIATSRYVRDHGTGKPVAGGISGAGLGIALLTGVLACLAALPWLTPQQLAAGLAGLIIGHIGMRLLFERKLGGYTGDTLGAVQQASLLGVWLGLAAAS